MTTQKDIEFLQEIIRATEAERIVWWPTAKVNEYTGSFEGRLSILIGRDPEGEYYLRMKAEDGQVFLRLTNQEIQVLSTPASGDVVQITVNPIRQLFEIASRKAFHADKRIDEFLQDLKRG